MKGKSLSRVLPSVTPWTEAFQAPPPMRFSRQEYWSGVPLPSPIQPDCCPYKKRKGCQGRAGTEERPREDAVIRQPPASQGQQPQQKPTLLTPCLWTSSLQDYKKKMSVGSATQSVVFCDGGLGRLSATVMVQPSIRVTCLQ